MLTNKERPLRFPPVVLLLGGAILVAFFALGQFDPNAHQALFNQWGVVPARFDAPMDYVVLAAPLFGHVFFHYGVAHILMNGLAFMDAAPFVASRLGAVRFLVLFFASALGGALAYILINAHSEIGAVGASGAICGLFGAYFLGVRPSPQAALADPRVRRAIVVFLGINVVLFALLPLPIAWEAHLGGFIAGAIAYPLLAPKCTSAGPWG
ncbi:glpG protein [alpha proteobacterium U9-1i]|nr:glpG protein [alpha proteobacterium U9-1i]